MCTVLGETKMAKKSGRRGHSSYSPTHIPNRPLARLPVLSPSHRLTPSTPYVLPDLDPGPLTEVEDRRTYHPLGPNRPARTLGGTPARITVADRPASKRQRASGFHRKLRSSHTKAVLAFAEPKRVLICIRRQRRKEVLHALGRAGRGGAKRHPRRSWHSEVSC